MVVFLRVDFENPPIVKFFLVAIFWLLSALLHAFVFRLSPEVVFDFLIRLPSKELNKINKISQIT